MQSQPGLQKEFSASTGNLVRPGAKLKDKKRDGGRHSSVIEHLPNKHRLGQYPGLRVVEGY